MSSITNNFESVQATDNNTKECHPFVGEMEPGVVYEIDPGKTVVQRLKRRNSQLNKRLRISRICNILIGILFIVVCIYSCTKFHQLNESFEELSKKYDEIIAADASVASKTNIINQRISDYYTQLALENSETTETEDMVEEDAISIPEKFDEIPLDDELKNYIYTSALNADIPPEIMFGLGFKESSFTPTAVSASDDHGLFQINRVNFARLAEHFGYTYEEFCEKIYDPYFNTDCSIYILSECRDRYSNDNWHHVLMRYNMGPGRTSELLSEGIYSSEYSRYIVNYAQETYGLVDIAIN